MRLHIRGLAGTLLLLLAGCFLAYPSAAHAANAPVMVDVWPAAAPGETGTPSTGRVTVNPDDPETLITDISRPQLFVYELKGGGVHPAVLVLPGGGYQLLASDKEGAEIARWLNRQGFVAGVLNYRVPNKELGAFQDGQRALSLLRARAGEFGLGPKRLGVMGFSAGGHLAARLAAATGERSYAAVDSSDQADDHPAFALLVYPAYLTANAAQTTPERVAEAQPHAGMPPVFLAQTYDDYYLDAPGYAAELNAAKVPTELHMYPSGGHGYALRAGKDVPASRWADAVVGWLEQFK